MCQEDIAGERAGKWDVCAICCRQSRPAAALTHRPCPQLARSFCFPYTVIPCLRLSARSGQTCSCTAQSATTMVRMGQSTAPSVQSSPYPQYDPLRLSPALRRVQPLHGPGEAATDGVAGTGLGPHTPGRQSSRPARCGQERAAEEGRGSWRDDDEREAGGRFEAKSC